MMYGISLGGSMKEKNKFIVWLKSLPIGWLIPIDSSLHHTHS